MMIENRKLKVFLCHASNDKPFVRKIHARLKKDGFDSWLDERKLLPGQDWDLEIHKAVKDADAVVIFISEGSTTKAGYFQKEIRLALDVADEQPEGSIFLIPARLENCMVPTRLNKWQWVDLFESVGYEKLKIALEFRARGLNIPVKERMKVLEPAMIKIPTGSFLMGSSPSEIKNAQQGVLRSKWIKWEQPKHRVELSEYSISKYPITNQEYQVFVKDAKYRVPVNWKDSEFPTGKGNFPVVNVTWNDANAFCSWLRKRTGKQYRLPTEAEWEKAARGIDGRIFPWGNEFDSGGCNTAEANIGQLTPIGQFSPAGDSPFGCSEMIGNVKVWCYDFFTENEYKNRLNTKDPRGPQHGSWRVVRGASFTDTYKSAHCSFRNAFDHDAWQKNLGFRVALSLYQEG